MENEHDGRGGTRYSMLCLILASLLQCFASLESICMGYRCRGVDRY